MSTRVDGYVPPGSDAGIVGDKGASTFGHCERPEGVTGTEAGTGRIHNAGIRGTGISIGGIARGTAQLGTVLCFTAAVTAQGRAEARNAALLVSELGRARISSLLKR